MDVITVDGDLSFETAPRWWNDLLPRLNGDTLVLDLSHVARADSAGLALLISLLGIAQQKNTSLQLRRAPAQLLQIARVSGVESLLPFQLQDNVR